MKQRNILVWLEEVTDYRKTWQFHVKEQQKQESEGK